MMNRMEKLRLEIKAEFLELLVLLVLAVSCCALDMLLHAHKRFLQVVGIQADHRDKKMTIDQVTSVVLRVLLLFLCYKMTNFILLLVTFFLRWLVNVRAALFVPVLILSGQSVSLEAMCTILACAVTICILHWIWKRERDMAMDTRVIQLEKEVNMLYQWR